ncbi:MAG: terminase family protein [Phycisphaerae bacterium]
MVAERQRRGGAKRARPADAGAAALVTLLPYQRRAIECNARFTWNNWSRQTGKSFAFALRRVIRGMRRNRNQILLSAGERQSRELMAKVRLHLASIRSAVDGTIEDYPDSEFDGTTFGKLETRVRHRSGAFDFRIIALPANPETARGYTGDLLLDEFAMHRDDREIWSAIYPVAMRGGGEIDICSTPKGRKNLFYKLASNDVFARSRVTIEDAQRDGLEVDIETLRAGMDDPDAFAQEFLCEFQDEATAFLTFEQIAGCEDAQLDTGWDDDRAAALGDEALYVGVDVGRHRDLTVIWIWGRPHGTGLLVTRGVVEMAKAPFAAQRQMIDVIVARRNVRRCCVDQTGLGTQLAEELVAKHGHRVEPVTFGIESKADMAGALRVKVEDRTVRIPVDVTIRNDWHSIERQVLPGGGVRYAADRGVNGHADRFWAAALGVRAATSAPPIDWSGAWVCPVAIEVYG